jgi:hypothetical protein
LIIKTSTKNARWGLTDLLFSFSFSSFFSPFLLPSSPFSSFPTLVKNCPAPCHAENPWFMVYVAIQ